MMSKPTSAANSNQVYLTRGGLAKAMGVSVPTIDEWRSPKEFEGGMPCVEEGDQGHAYKFDIEDCLAWRARRDSYRDEVYAERDRQVAAAHEQLDLNGGESSGVDALPLKMRREYYETEMGRMKAAKLRGELIELTEHEAELIQIFQSTARFLQSLPDVLARECDIEPGTIGTLQEKIDTHQETLARLFMSERNLDDVDF